MLKVKSRQTKQGRVEGLTWDCARIQFTSTFNSAGALCWCRRCGQVFGGWEDPASSHHPPGTTSAKLSQSGTTHQADQIRSSINILAITLRRPCSVSFLTALSWSQEYSIILLESKKRVRYLDIRHDGLRNLRSVFLTGGWSEWSPSKDHRTFLDAGRQL